MKNITDEADARVFINGELDNEALDYLLKLDGSFNAATRVHVLRCLKSIVARLFKLAPSGDFGQAILRNDLREAVLVADNTNRYCLYLYIMFLANKVPAKRIWDARKELEG